MPKKYIKYVSEGHEQFMEENKKVFIKLLRNLVTSRDIEPMIAYLERTTFFTDPASAKYHSSFDGGLCYHSMEVLRLLQVKVASLNLDRAFPKEVCAVVALLHDVVKIGSYKYQARWQKDENDKWETIASYGYNTNIFPVPHGAGSVLKILEHFPLEKMEQLAIANHMGREPGSYDFNNAAKISSLVTLLHTADVEAALVFEEQDPMPDKIRFPKDFEIKRGGVTIAYGA